MMDFAWTDEHHLALCRGSMMVSRGAHAVGVPDASC